MTLARKRYSEEVVDMNQELINAFLEPAKIVWEKELAMDLVFEGAEPIQPDFVVEDIVAVIGVSGSLKGNVLYGFGSISALVIAGQMMGEPVEEVDHVCFSILGELANMITGNAVTGLESQGMKCDITPPIIIEPSGAKLSTGDSQVVARFGSEAGGLNIRFSLK